MASTSGAKVPVDFKTASGNTVMVSAAALAAAEEWLKRMNCDDVEAADPGVEHEFDEFADDFGSDTVFGAAKQVHDSLDDGVVFEEAEPAPDSFNEELVLKDEDEETPRPTTPAPTSSTASHSTPVRAAFVIRRSSNLPTPNTATPKTPSFTTNTSTADVTPMTPTMNIRNHSSVHKPFKTPTISAEAKAKMMATHQTNIRKRKSVCPDSSSTTLTPEQRARSERNRLEALAKRRAIAQGGSVVPHASAS